MSAAEARDRAIKEKEAVELALEVSPSPFLLSATGKPCAPDVREKPVLVLAPRSKSLNMFKLFIYCSGAMARAGQRDLSGVHLSEVLSEVGVPLSMSPGQSHPCGLRAKARPD